MKVGILTFHNVHNYGAVLQNYALVSFLSKNENLIVETIDYRCPAIENPARFRMITKYSGNPVKKAVHAAVDLLYLRKRYKSEKNFSVFRKEHLNLSEIQDENKLLSGEPEYDVFIVGSDQVWNKNITCRNENDKVEKIYTLSFVDKAKRISYAASAGHSSNLDSRILKYLNRFSYISVRENELASFLREKTKQRVYEVIDPVLLLKQDDWNTLLPSKPMFQYKYIFVYYIVEGQKVIEMTRRLAEITGYKIVYINHNYPFYFDDAKCVCEAGPLDFVQLIRDAEFVVTSSFHATAFSVIFNKKLYCYSEHQTGSRIFDLLKSVGRLDAIATDIVEPLHESPVADEVQSKVDYLRQQSIDYLRMAVVGEENPVC